MKTKTNTQTQTTEEYLYPETISALLEKWDKGEPIFTIELGGLGPGYEQAIQLAAVEFSRKCRDLTGIIPNDKESTERFTKCCDEVLSKINQQLGGLSGAQFGAARWLAWQWCFGGGPKALIERAKKEGKEDQITQASNYFPHVAQPNRER